MKNLFEKIINREIPSDIVYEDNVSIAFYDINPQAPTHILIIPKKRIERPDLIDKADEEVVGHLFSVARIIANKLNISTKDITNIESGKAIHNGQLMSRINNLLQINKKNNNN